MEEKICCIAKYVWDVPLIVAILSTGLYLSAASGFFSVRQLPGAIIEVAQDYWRNRTSGERQGGLRPYEVFFISLGTTVGFGSITGVALAVIIGGSGAIFWMWVSSLIGMVIKMAEVTLAAYYRNTEKKDQYYGSPMDYMEKGIGKAMNFAAWRIPVALFGAGFAATFIITLQDYEVVDTVRHAVGIDPWLVVTVYVLLTYLCIYKGIDGYRKIACWLVPSFLLFYVAGGILIIISNGERLLPCLVSIFQAAFDGQALLGGLAGRGLMEVVGQGLSISVFTTEAGWGTASMLYARADTRHPVSLGRLGALEVFLVSMVICTTTALAIVVAGQQTVGISASELIIRTFATGMGALAPYFVAVMAFLFGLTTVVGWFLYMEEQYQTLKRQGRDAEALQLINGFVAKKGDEALGAANTALDNMTKAAADASAWKKR